ncbi:uncharacterized protein LOC126625414 [Malus sylvestris]|uniref:uncharacterized protein LOC126625414 n=1 Tax=Malus sylvestris TaxID=3752 RepID=UPI0021ACEEEB|nr:uncharacterized protein LOC126625414 [Malus sylvestris]
MANFAKLDFAAIDTTGKKYLTWLCGDTITEEDLLEKTFSTFHASNVLLQQQYRARGFTEYNQLISVLLVAEQNNKLLVKNHQSRPTGSAPFPKVNAVSLEVNTTSFGGDNRKRGHGHKQGRWNRKGKNHGDQFHIQVPMHNSEEEAEARKRQMRGRDEEVDGRTKRKRQILQDLGLKWVVGREEETDGRTK